MRHQELRLRTLSFDQGEKLTTTLRGLSLLCFTRFSRHLDMSRFVFFSTGSFSITLRRCSQVSLRPFLMCSFSRPGRLWTFLTLQSLSSLVPVEWCPQLKFMTFLHQRACKCFSRKQPSSAFAFVTETCRG